MAMSRAICTGASALALVMAMPAAAQTVIIPDTAAPITTETTVSEADSVTTIDGGRRVGNNLFHSFSAFSLGTGETALWIHSGGDGASIANIINRITGGVPSSIDGTLATTGMAGANFFFINPAGIVFGANAEIAVPNIAHFSTAGSLRFADGQVFGVTTPGGSVFSMAAPAAFGFLGGQGNITINGAGPGFVGRNTGLAFSAANIAITGAEFITGSLDLIALGNATRTLALADPLAVRSGAGTVSSDNSFISVQPNAVRDGLVRINAGRLAVTDTILASDSNDRPAAGMRVLAGDVVLRGTPAGTQITFLGSFAPDAGDAGDVDIDALRIFASDTAQISSQALDGATGNAGAIRIRTGLLSLSGGASIISSAYGQSDSGSIDIMADVMTMASGAIIETTTFGSGDGGDMTINVGSLTMDEAVIAAEAELFATGSAGFIALTAQTIAMDNGARISSSNFGLGFGGLLDITANTITLRNGSRIESDALGPDSGGGGLVFVKGGAIRIETGSEISSVTEGAADAGFVSVEADSLVIDGGLINSSSFGSGQAGAVLIDAASVDLRNGGEITTSTFAEGRAGQIAINARTITMSSGAEISSETLSSGQAGNIVIGQLDGVKPDLTITGGARITSSQTGPNATGNAGSISIDANRIVLGPSSRPAISTNVANAAFAGFIEITARSLLLDGGQIASGATGTLDGEAGDIIIAADTITLINGGRIESSSASPGPAGRINLLVDRLVVQGEDAAVISENISRSGGDAGAITVEANRIELLDGGAISTNSLAGVAGDISLLFPTNGVLLLRGATRSGVITTSSGPGTGGIITIASPYLILSDGGQILALGEASGADVLIQSGFFIRSADRLNLLSVNGSLLLDSQVGDLSTGAEQVDLSFLDASSVLRGQCAGNRRGGTNQLNLRAFGPNTAMVMPSTTGERPIVMDDTSGQTLCAR
ncbi:MAG: filamentous hemagglutinin N-terminal domain-containing protein [Sphingomonadales bacterium]|nr:MAG: filamentous hemagglutinin N-terminal domain-containing protein [Sphingomonadales bacterium]